MDVILYGSLHGAAKRYAEHLAGLTGIKAFDYKYVKDLGQYDRVIHLGGIYAHGVTGLKKTVARMSPNQELFLATVGMVDPEDKAFFDAFKESLKKQIPPQLYDEKKIFHLRGAIDYDQLELKYRILMKLMYSQASKMPEDQLTAEFKAVLATYGQKVDCVNLDSLNPLIHAMKKLIAICGLDCEKCDAYIATKNNDQALREKTAKLWSELNNAPILPEHINCDGCRVNGRKTVFCDRLCPVRQCALSKGFETCGECPEKDTCPKVGAIWQNNPNAKNNLESI